MDKKFVDRLLASLPDSILFDEVQRRVNARQAGMRPEFRGVTFKIGDPGLPLFPLPLYSFPVDIVRHWLLAKATDAPFFVSDLKRDCDGCKAMHGDPDAGRSVYRLRGRGVEHIGTGVYRRTSDATLFLTEDEFLRREA